MKWMFPVYMQTACAAWGTKIITLSCRLFMVAIFLRFLPETDYAALVILGGLEGWLLLLDCGLGSSVQIFLSESRARGLSDEGLLKTAFVFGLIACFVGFLLLYGNSSLLSSFFLSSTLSQTSAKELLVLSCSFLLLGTFGSIAGKVLMARQKGYIFYVIQAIGSILSLGLLSLGSFYGKLTLLFGSFCLFGIPALVSFICAVGVFVQVEWKDRIRLDMLKKAKSFFVFSCLAALVTLSDALMIPRVLQIQEIIQYNLLCKIFGIASFIYSAFLQSFSPVCSEYLARSLFRSVEKKLVLFCFVGIAGIWLFTLAVCLFIPYLESVFTRALPMMGILCFALYLCTRVISDFYTMALQSVGYLRPFFFLVPVQAVLSISMQYYLSSYFGLVGILLGLSLSYLVTACWFLPRELNHLRMRQEGQVRL